MGYSGGVGGKRGKRKNPRDKDLTSQYLRGAMEEDALDSVERYSGRDASAQKRKMEQTAQMRLSDEVATPDVEKLPIGDVAQVYSRFAEVEHEGTSWLCVVRKTMTKLGEPPIVGDRVRFRDTGMKDERGKPEAVIEQILPRQTVLTRADSFKAIVQQPIVANAKQMLIVTSLKEPRIKWGIIDRMMVAAQGGGLTAILCMNKMDLVNNEEMEFARAAMDHYGSLGARTLETSVTQKLGLEELRELLRGGPTVLAGQSGVGKSSLIGAIEPELDLRIGAISGYTGKGRHTTTSAKRYRLSDGGYVIDTPGVKLFGLWGVSRDNLSEYFPDVVNGTSPPWRVESYERILESLPD
ncbi:MAG TPA: ribosome small subunit-dependent GTPase A [Tepidisphaeraceae bacterium]|nr:ribosome small subunit-dependent GTPase A [Tepidisphaeraceae bacterium]